VEYGNGEYDYYWFSDSTQLKTYFNHQALPISASLVKYTDVILTLELKKKGTSTLALKLIFKFSYNKESTVTAPDGWFASDLEEGGYFAMAGVPWYFSTCATNEKNQVYLYTWYKDGKACGPETATPFLYIPESEMKLDSSGLFYPAEAVYRVEARNPLGGKLLISNEAKLYIFSD
jgi:hypothetical protein